jgi:hypothetical protein
MSNVTTSVNTDNYNLWDTLLVSLADTAEMSSNFLVDPDDKAGHLDPEVPSDGSKEPNGVLVEARRNCVNKFKTPIVEILRKTNTSVQREIPEDDYDAVIQASNVVLASYLICITHSEHLANSLTKYFEKERYEKARDRLIQRASDYIKSKYLLEVDHSRKCYWADFFKYKFMAFYAYWLGQSKELPPPIIPGDLPNVILGGSYGKLLHRLKHKDIKSFDLLVETVNYLKKGMPTVPLELVKAKVEETFDHLTSSEAKNFEEVSWSWFPNLDTYDRNHKGAFSGIFDTSDAIDECVRTTYELFQNSQMSYDQLIKPFVGSVNSSYDNSKAHGGQALWIAEMIKDIPLPNNLTDFLDLEDILFDVVGCLSEQYGVESRISDEEMIRNLNINSEPVHIVSGKSFSDNKINLYFEQVYWKIWKIAIDQDNYAIPIGLSEPLKVRVIMKGRAAKYFCMRPFQKWMHNHLRKHPNLIAIGQPITKDLVNSFFENPSYFEEYVNGDFQQSTNLIFSPISEAIGNQLCNLFFEKFKGLEYCIDQDTEFCSNFRKMVIDCLTHHEICLKKIIDGKENQYIASQKTGQSMGSPISFPVLCIANLAGARRTCELREGRRIGLGKDFKCWINGDDVTFRSKLGVYYIWKEIMSTFGLYSSPGKTFCSEVSKPRHFIMLNSMRFQWNSLWKSYELIPYVNFGVLLAKKKSSVSTDVIHSKEIFELASLQKDLLSRAPDHSDFLNLIFTSYHKDKLDSYRLPWFLPTWVGGLGLTLTESFELSDWDRRMATVIKKQWEAKHPVNIFSESSWWMWRKAASSLGVEKSNYLMGRPISKIYMGNVEEPIVSMIDRSPSGYNLDLDNQEEFTFLEESYEDYMNVSAVASFYLEANRFYKIQDCIKRIKNHSKRLDQLWDDSLYNLDFDFDDIETAYGQLKSEYLNDCDFLGRERCSLPECFSLNLNKRKNDLNCSFEVIDVKDQTKNLKYNEKFFKNVNKKLKNEFLRHHPMSDEDLAKERKSFYPPVKRI